MPKKKPTQRNMGPIRWEFDPDIPTLDFFEDGPLDDMSNLQEAVESFVHWIERGRFLTWEAVVCEEQGIELSPRHKKEMGELISFNDEDEFDDDRVLYIDEIPRPSEPWHVILNKIAQHLLIEPYRTSDSHWGVQVEGWEQIIYVLRQHGQGLSLPPGVESLEDVVPAELRHKLILQDSFRELDGLGEGESTLENAKELERIDWFIKILREYKDSVAFFALSLDSLLERVILPERDRPIFLKHMQEKLGLSSTQEPIASHL